MTGACAQCLMRVAGEPNVQACLVPARAGLRVEHQNAFPDVKLDLLQATDLVFPSWFNHHEFMAGVPVAEKVMAKVARRLAGLGLLPERVSPEAAPAKVERHARVIVGGGAAGLAAAKVFSERDAAFVLFERDLELGGRLINTAEEGAPPRFSCPASAARLNETVVGLWADEGSPYLVTTSSEGARVVFFERVLLAHGGYPALVEFKNNDLPGIYAGRAVAKLVRRHGVLPGQTIAVVGEPDEAKALAKLLTSVGAEVVAVGHTPLKAFGFGHVQSITVRGPQGESRHAVDAVAVCAAQSPSFELARAAGAKVSWHPTHRSFTVEADSSGRTANPAVFVAGELRSPMSAAAAAEQGLVAADAMMRERT